MIVRRARYSKIERLVEAILADHDISTPPVPIKSIILDTGIDLRTGDLGDVSGLIARSADSTIIGVNSTQAPVRQRFTMAHEFGHYLLHEGLAAHSDKSFRVNYRDEVSSEASNVEEIEANFFAASILMPKHFLDELNADEALDDDAKVSSLAKRFNVSRHAMSLRLANVYRTYSPF